MWVTVLVENVKLPSAVVHITKKATGEEIAKFDAYINTPGANHIRTMY